MGSLVLLSKDETRFLGVKIDANINFKPHLSGLSKTLDFLSRTCILHVAAHF